MAIPVVTEAQCREKIKAYIAFDKQPILSDSSFNVLVLQSFFPDKLRNAPDLCFERVGNRSYILGERMIPQNRNGHYYTCTTAGTTAVIEPTFPGTSLEIVIDGTAEWTESGVALWTPTYVPEFSIADGWIMKAGLVAGNYQFSSDGQTFNRQQVYEHCMLQVKQWEKYKTGSTRIKSEIRRRSNVPDAFTWQRSEQYLEDLGLI